MAVGWAASVLLHIMAHSPVGYTTFFTWEFQSNMEGVNTEAEGHRGHSPRSCNMSLPLHYVGQRSSQANQESKGAEIDPTS